VFAAVSECETKSWFIFFLLNKNDLRSAVLVLLYS
jgi:hypothetical protein